SGRASTSPRPFPSAVPRGGTSHSCPAALPCRPSCARGAAPLAPSAPSPRSSPARYPTDWPSFPPGAGCARRLVPGLLPASADPSTASRLDELTRPRLYAASPPSRPWAAPSAPRISFRGHGLKLLHSALRFNLVWFLHSDSPFLGKRKLLLAYQGCERGVATFYDLPGIPAAIIKLFLRSGNARRVLFLVDRLELEDQAKKAFAALLAADYQTVIFKENRDDWRRAEIVVSTVQSFLFNNKYQQLFSPT